MAALKISAKLKVENVRIGAVGNEGGTRCNSVTIGGQAAMPFLFEDGPIPNPPLNAYEFWDVTPGDWSPHLVNLLKEVWDDPVKWAEFLINKSRASILFLRLMGAHPDYGEKNPEQIGTAFRRIIDKIKTPLVVVGCGIQDIDKKLLPVIAAEASGERLLIGSAIAESYREITSACLEHGHNLITESPIDINLAKQANILVQDKGCPSDKIVMYATTGALGYGLEYAYSIMEKTRLLGLRGDRYMNKPQIAFIGQETWRTREANLSEEMGVMWETVTSIAYLHSGADMVVLRHPESGKRVREYVESMFDYGCDINAQSQI